MAVKKTSTTKKAPGKAGAAARSTTSEPVLQALPEEVWRDLFGLAKKADRDFGEKLVSALNKIDRGLLPPASTHPFEAEIARGAAGVDTLLQLTETGTEKEWFNALDALAHVFFAMTAPDTTAGSTVPSSSLERLRKQLAGDRSADQRALVMKTLAIARDEGVLREQLMRLADSDPGVVATAARLLGLGRYAPAAAVLRELVSPERFYESRAVIWALGEIGDPAVLPALYRSLAQAFRVVDCLIAIGKIGQITSVGELTPMILQGVPEERDAAWRALAMILDHHRNAQAALGEIFAQLKGLIESQLSSDTELSGSTRFHMMLCLARMGVTLDPARVRRHLQLGVDDAEASAVARVFEKKTPRKK
ncbi:MAG: HEAT repeat domain-containing protein [Deltaproteobacteria bacterium]|nr:HEAT repeat domain-containing protein [Deltaproteobacteria bacterium]